MKKVISVFLAVLTVVTVFPMSAFANNPFGTEASEDMYAYKEILDMYHTSISCNWSNCDGEGWDDVGDPDNACYIFYHYEAERSLDEVGYMLLDINNDGQSELFVTIADNAQDGSFCDMYTIVDGVIIHVIAAGERDCYNLAEDYSINNIGSSSAFTTSFDNYRLDKESGDLRINKAVLYDEWEDPDNPWFYTNMDYYDRNTNETVDDAWIPISEEEYYAIADSFPDNLAFELTTFDEYSPSEDEETNENNIGKAYCTYLKGLITDYSPDILLDSVEYELKDSFNISFTSFSDSIMQRIGAYSACYADINNDNQDELIAVCINKNDNDDTYTLALICFYTGDDNYIYFSKLDTQRYLTNSYASYSCDVYIENGYIYISNSFASGIEGSGSNWRVFTSIYDFKYNNWNCLEDYFYGVNYGTEIFVDNVNNISFNITTYDPSILEQMDTQLQQKKNKLKNTYKITTSDETKIFDSSFLRRSNDFLWKVEGIVEENDKQDKCIAVLTTEKSLSVKTGDSMWLAFGLMDNSTGMLNEGWRKMAVSVSDPTVISLSAYEETEYGYSLEVTGKKEGATNVVITDTESGVFTEIVISVYDLYNKSYSYDIDNIATFYPQNKWESDIATNIYNLNGLYVNNYTCKKSNGKYYVTFDVYNERYHTASVDIYNAFGEWTDCEPIEKYTDVSSISDTVEQIYYLIADPITGKWLTYEQATLSKHTLIEIEVPEGGYFTISNNFAESPGTFLFNSCEIIYNAACTLLDLLTSDEIKLWEFSGMLKESIVDDAVLREEFIKLFIGVAENEIRDYTKNIIEGNIDEATAGLSGLFENMLNSMELDWKHLFKSVTGIGESAFELLAGAAGAALKGCFEISELSSQLLQALHLARSVDATYASVYSEVDYGYINPHGVIVNTNGNIDYEAVLQVFRVSDSDSIDVVLNLDNPLEKYELYNICFVKNDKLVQPNGKVKVFIPIPEGMDGYTCNIFRQESDGSWAILDAYVEGSYLVFETDHFSLYAVIGNVSELSVYSVPEKINYYQEEKLDTEGLILELHGEWISEGYLCDPTVMSGCGMQTIKVTYGHAETQFDVYTHNVGNWEVVKNAEVGMNGLEQRCCTICGVIVDERVIPALENDPDDGEPRFSIEGPFDVNVGETFDIIVAGKDIYGLTACTLSFIYNESIVQLVSSELLMDADLYSQAINDNIGNIREGIVFTEKLRQEDTDIVKYTFIAVASGECYIEICAEDWAGTVRPIDLGRSIMVSNLHEHTPGSWEVVTAAQIGVDGLEQQKCTVCGEIVDEKVIPALPDYLVGDANGDGKITAADARIALRISAKVDSLEKYNLTAAVLDVTGDGKLTAADARKILRIAAKIE